MPVWYMRVKKNRGYGVYLHGLIIIGRKHKKFTYRFNVIN